MRSEEGEAGFVRAIYVHVCACKLYAPFGSHVRCCVTLRKQTHCTTSLLSHGMCLMYLPEALIKESCHALNMCPKNV